MKRFSQRGGHSTMAELNVTPLLDLAFVLLIIFIITTPLIEQGIEMNLPTASPSPNAVQSQKVKTISLNKKGQIFIGQNKVSELQLEAELREWKRQNPQVAVVLKADKEIRYQELVNVFDALQRAQITKLGLINTPDEAKKGR